LDRPVFIGDEVTAAGYRLAGLEVRTAEPAQARAALDQARSEEPPVILVTAELARAIPPAEMDGLVASAHPPIQVVADAGGRTLPPDLAARIRSQVGAAE
jgi:vacuolar-type H+-ATPase subunit F/Vma7